MGNDTPVNVRLESGQRERLLALAKELRCYRPSLSDAIRHAIRLGLGSLKPEAASVAPAATASSTPVAARTTTRAKAGAKRKARR
jgi:hypothetical protein